jgi:hypothetical protein
MKSFAYRRKLNDCCEKSNITKLNIHERTQVEKKHCTTLYTETNYSVMRNAVLKGKLHRIQINLFLSITLPVKLHDGVVAYCREACRDSD